MYGHIIYLDRKRVGGNASLLRRTNYAHIRTCSLYGGRVMQGRQAGSESRFLNTSYMNT